MILTTDRRELLAVARQVSKAASRNVIEELKNIHLEADGRKGMITLTATNFEIAIRSSVPASVTRGGSSLVNAYLLLNILERLPGDKMSFEAGDGHIKMQGGKAEYLIRSLPSKGYPLPEFPFPEDTVTISGVRSLARKTLHAIKNNEQNPALSCVNLTLGDDGLKAIGCDGTSIAQSAGDKECKGHISLLIPAPSFQTLAAISADESIYETGVADNGKTAVFFDGTLMFSARLVSGAYLDTDKVFAAFKGKYAAKANAEKLRQAIKPIIAMQGAESRIGIKLNTGEISVTYELAGNKASASVPAMSEKGSPVHYHDGKRLLRCLYAMDGDIEIAFSERGDLTVRDGASRYMQVVMREPKQKTAAKKAA